jgi:dTDP-N-acetylfucosamine:lipid II N-acetylfucosaminyltransferase
LKYLHLIHNDKFTNPYIDFINKNFDANEHLFLIAGGVSEEIIKISKRENVITLSKDFTSLFTLINRMYKCEKIFLHGLFNFKIVFLLFLQPWLLKKSNWIVWGGDLYYYKSRNRDIKSDIREYIRTFVIKRMSGLITHIKGDYDLARAWYGVKGKYYYSFLYPSNLYKEYDLSKVEKDNGKKYIQVGNSADPSNNHLEVFNKLSNFKDNKIEIICPLSYGGDLEYKQNVITAGRKIFGDKFNPITELLPLEEYLNLLAKVDIAVFAHKRQQAIGNITTLLGLGKKVYIRDDITTWDFCKEHGLKVYSINNFDEKVFLQDITEDEKKMNIENVKCYFSKEKLVQDWRKIFL